jgi:hypothetical protein
MKKHLSPQIYENLEIMKTTPPALGSVKQTPSETVAAKNTGLPLAHARRLPSKNEHFSTDPCLSIAEAKF